MRPPATSLLIAALGLALAPALAGCSGCGADEGDDEPAEASGHKATGGEGASAETGDEGSGETDPGPPPTVRVAAEPAEIERGFVPVVQSRGEEPAKLARELEVEREKDGEWSRVATVSLRFSCDEPAKDDCVTLVPGAELRPPRWRARRGEGAQCDGGDEPAPAGTYRFVAESCNGAHTLPGEPFEH